MPEPIYACLLEVIMKTKTAIAAALMSACLVTAARADDAFLGAIFGAGAGALVGKSLGGRDGAIIGGALGAATGVALANQRREYRPRVDYAPQPVYYRQPAIASPVYYVQDDRYGDEYRNHEWQQRRWEHERERHEFCHEREREHHWERGWER